MQWNPWKKETPAAEVKSPGSVAADSQVEEFERAAAEVVAEAPAGEAPAGDGGSSAAGERGFDLSSLRVSEENAREVVKACFWPLAHYVDPAWALTDAEAQRATPQMQKFLEWLLLRYAPLFTLKLASRFPELLAVLVAMAMLAWTKAMQVEKAKRERAAMAEVVAAAARSGAESESFAGAFECEVCGRGFLSRESLGAHLPCAG